MSLVFHIHLQFWNSFNIKFLSLLEFLVLFFESLVFSQKILITIEIFKLEWIILNILRLKFRLHHRSSVIKKVFFNDIFRLKLLLDVYDSSVELLRLLLVSHRLINVAKTLEAFDEECGFGVSFKFFQQQVCNFVVDDGLRNLAFLYKILAAVKQPNHMIVNILLG